MNTVETRVRRAARANCLGEVRNHRTFYGNRRGSRAVQGFKLRFTGLYIAGFPSYTDGHRSICHLLAVNLHKRVS